MDTLERLTLYTDRIDIKIIVLFEKRMGLVKKAAEYKKKHGLKIDSKKHDKEIIDKVTDNICDAEFIQYTEELIICLLSASKKFQCRYLKRKKCTKC